MVLGFHQGGAGWARGSGENDHRPVYPAGGLRSKARPVNWTGTVSPSQSHCSWGRGGGGTGRSRGLEGPCGSWRVLEEVAERLPGGPSSPADPAPLGSPAIHSCTVGNGGCQHHCIQLTVSQHRCQCRPEFQLQEDGKRCVRECHSPWAGGGRAGQGPPRGPRCRHMHRPTQGPRNVSPGHRFTAGAEHPSLLAVEAGWGHSGGGGAVGHRPAPAGSAMGSSAAHRKLGGGMGRKRKGLLRGPPF